MTRLRPSPTLVLAFALLAAGALASAASSHPAETHLANARVSTPADGRLVINLEAAGDLPGLLTLNLHVDGDGSLRGDWALVVRTVDTTDPATGEEPPAAGAHQHEGDEGDHEGEPAPHRDFVRIVDRGTMAGTIDGATVALGADGTLTDLSAALTILQGSLEFEVASGSGSATLSSLALQF